MSIKFIPRTKKPEAGNKYYIRKAQGGYSDAVQGSPTDKDCNVLSNCVGYAYGRFNEIGNWGYCKYLAPVDAKNFMDCKGSCKTGMTPKVGSCMVWTNERAGHVAIVEKVVSSSEIITSESEWGGRAFYTMTRKKGDGNWGYGGKFLGFIYNPADLEETPSTETNTEVPIITGISQISPTEIEINFLSYKNPTNLDRFVCYYDWDEDVDPRDYAGMKNIEGDSNVFRIPKLRSATYISVVIVRYTHTGEEYVSELSSNILEPSYPSVPIYYQGNYHIASPFIFTKGKWKPAVPMMHKDKNWYELYNTDSVKQ